MSKILFVCTGNIFRSMSAEYVMKHLAPEELNLTISSAGTEARIEPIHPDVLLRLTERGIDPSKHVQRRVTPEILAEQDIVIAMSTDHKEHLRKMFNRDSVLYYEISHGEARAFPDLWEVVPDFRTNKDASREYLHKAVDIIYDSMPLILQRLPQLGIK